MMDSWPSIECAPLGTSRVRVGQVFESGAFYLKRAFIDNDPILLSELWGLKRVSPTFGLSEVVPSRVTWDAYGIGRPEYPLLATSEIMSLEEKYGLIFCTMRTETINASSGRPLLRTTDELLLSHYCRKPFFIEESHPQHVESFLLKNPIFYGEYTVSVDSETVRAGEENSIHTDSYAKSCGFKSALPKFATYIDRIHHAIQKSGWFLKYEPIRIRLTKALPLYHGEVVRVITHREGEEELHVLFLDKDGAVRVTAVATPLGRAHL